MGGDAARELSTSSSVPCSAADHSERKELRRSSLPVSRFVDSVHVWRLESGRQAGGGRVFQPRNIFDLWSAGGVSSSVSMAVAGAVGRGIGTLSISAVDDSSASAVACAPCRRHIPDTQEKAHLACDPLVCFCLVLQSVP